MEPVRLLMVAAVIACGFACDGAGEDGPFASPENTFHTMQRYVADGEYQKVWSLLSVEARRQWIKGMREHKEIVRSAGVNKDVIERQVREQYGIDSRDFLAAIPEELYARVMAMTAGEMPKLSVKEPARIEGDKAFLSLAKDLGPGRDPYPYPIVLPFVKRSGRWLIADNPTGQPDVPVTYGFDRPKDQPKDRPK